MFTMTRTGWVGIATTAAVAALFGLGIPASTMAQADASGTTSFGGKWCEPKTNVCFPRGRFTVRTNSMGGKGRKIARMTGSFTYVGQLCNWWIDHDVFSGGASVYHLQGAEKGCVNGVGGEQWTWRPGTYYLAPAGSNHCATLYQRSSDTIHRLTRACNHIS